MLGDSDDFAARLKRLLPLRWFSDTAANIGAVLSGFGAAWATVYGMVTYAQAQARITTSTGTFLDMSALDYFGRTFWRRKAEMDTAFALRLQREIVRLRVTRAGLVGALTDLTGTPPQVFEPANASDTGGWGAVGMTQGLGMAWGGTFVSGVGGWGSLALPYSVFVTAHRAHGGGIAGVMGIYLGSGWAGGGIASLADFGASAGAIEVVSLDMSIGQITDADIENTVVGVLPVAATVWLQITT